MANPLKAVKAAKKLNAGKKIYSAGIPNLMLKAGLQTTGKQKAINKAAKLNTKIEKYTDGQYYVTPNRAGDKIVFTGNRIKETRITGSNKKMNKNLREAVIKAGGKSKITNRSIVKRKKIEKLTPKVPTKKRGK